MAVYVDAGALSPLREERPTPQELDHAAVVDVANGRAFDDACTAYGNGATLKTALGGAGSIDRVDGEQVGWLAADKGGVPGVFAVVGDWHFRALEKVEQGLFRRLVQLEAGVAARRGAYDSASFSGHYQGSHGFFDSVGEIHQKVALKGLGFGYLPGQRAYRGADHRFGER